MLRDPKVGGNSVRQVFAGVWWVSDLGLTRDQIKVLEGKKWIALPGGWHRAPTNWDKTDPLEESQ